MADFKFECPFCKQRFVCDEKYSGREIQCASCQHLIHIPAIPGRTKQFQPEAGKTWATYVPSGAENSSGLQVKRPSTGDGQKR